MALLAKKRFMMPLISVLEIAFLEDLRPFLRRDPFLLLLCLRLAMLFLTCLHNPRLYSDPTDFFFQTFVVRSFFKRISAL